jgi:hypothetical protein
MERRAGRPGRHFPTSRSRAGNALPGLLFPNPSTLNQMIIWQGAGFLVVVVALGIQIVVQVGVNQALQDPTYYQTHGWPKLLGWWISGAAIFLIDRYANLRLGGRSRDQGPDQPMEPKPINTLFFIPMRFWAFILLGIGVYTFFRF